MAENKVVVNVDTTQIDAAQEKAKELEQTLVRVKELIQSLNQK